jgi:heptosyltransferase I
MSTADSTASNTESSIANRLEFKQLRDASCVALLNTQYADEINLAWISELADQEGDISGKNPAEAGDGSAVAWGRGSAKRFVLPTGREIIVRQLRRGGYVRFFARQSFLRFPGAGTSGLRPFAELQLLKDLWEQGVQVPCPVAASVKIGRTGFVYEGLLITEVIPGAVNLLELKQDLIKGAAKSAKFTEICRQAGSEARLMLDSGVAHADLHLGNVLYDEADRTFLIDLDKAQRCNPAKNPARRIEKLERRWAKSVNKHFAEYPQLAQDALRSFAQGLAEGGELVCAALAPKRALVILHGAIGDVVRALPLAMRLKKFWPETELHWAVEPISRPLVEGHPAVDKVIVFERPKGLPAYFGFVAELRKTRYDLVLDLQRHFKSGITSWLSGRARRVGFHRANAREFNWLFNNEHIGRLEHLSSKIWQFQRFGDLLGLPRSEKLEFGLYPREEELGQIEKVIVEACAAGGFPVPAPEKRVVLILGSTWESRFWLAEHYASLCTMLYEQRGLVAVLAGGKREQEFAGKVQGFLGRIPAVNLVEKTVLRELVAVFSKACLAIGSDAGPMHIASAVGLPVISLWGSTSAQRSAPYGSESLVLQSAVGCSPCYRRTCPGLDQVCMAEITPGDVMRKVDQLLGPAESG